MCIRYGELSGKGKLSQQYFRNYFVFRSAPVRHTGFTLFSKIYEEVVSLRVEKPNG